MQKDRDSCTGGSFLVLCTSPLSTWAHNKNHKSKIMGRVSKLSPCEQGCIVELHWQGRSCWDIAAELGRSKTAVNNFLRCSEAYGMKKPTGWPKKLSLRMKNAVLWSAGRSSGLSARQIAAENSLNVSKDTISRCLKAEGFCRRKRLFRPPPSRTSQGAALGVCQELLLVERQMEQDPVLGPCDVREGGVGPSAFFYGSPRPWGIGRWCPCWHRGCFQQQFVGRKGQSLVRQIAGWHSSLAGRVSSFGLLTSSSP